MQNRIKIPSELAPEVAIALSTLRQCGLDLAIDEDDGSDKSRIIKQQVETAHTIILSALLDKTTIDIDRNEYRYSITDPEMPRLERRE